MFILRIGLFLFFVLLLIIILLMLNQRRVNTYLYNRSLKRDALDEKEEIKRLSMRIEHEEAQLSSALDLKEKEMRLKEIQALKEEIKEIENSSR